jgi:hypothetical protein
MMEKDRYDTVSYADLKQAAARQEAYLKAKMVTVTDISKKAALASSRKSFNYQSGAKGGTRTRTELPTRS